MVMLQVVGSLMILFSLLTILVGLIVWALEKVFK